MKSILLSVKPQWVEKILNGKKTIEVRKQFPKDYVGWVYIYCTKDKKYANLINRGGFLTGMVVARFWCDKVEEIFGSNMISFEKDSCVDRVSMFKYLCPLTFWDNKLEKLLQANEGRKIGYAIHISKLEIFDKPKELSDFKPICQKFEKDTVHYSCIGCKYCNYDLPYPATRSSCLKKITKAPQNYCYIEGEIEE